MNRASQAYWLVENVEREVAELKARGVVFEEYDVPGVTTVNGISTAGGVRTAWFKDIEGNIFAIVQELATAPSVARTPQLYATLQHRSVRDIALESPTTAE